MNIAIICCLFFMLAFAIGYLGLDVCIAVVQWRCNKAYVGAVHVLLNIDRYVWLRYLHHEKWLGLQDLLDLSDTEVFPRIMHNQLGRRVLAVDLTELKSEALVEQRKRIIDETETHITVTTELRLTMKGMRKRVNSPEPIKAPNSLQPLRT